jgi:hypothetical protein
VARGVASGNPWLGHGVGKKSKRGEAPKRRQWSDAALVKVLSGAYTPRYTDMVGIVGARSLLTKSKQERAYLRLSTAVACHKLWMDFRLWRA